MIRLTKHHFLIALFASLMLFAVSCDNGSDPQDDKLPAEVKGKVVDAKSYALPNAVVKAGNGTDTTDASGNFTVKTGGFATRGKCTVEKTGYITADVNVPSSGDCGSVSIQTDAEAETCDAPFDVPAFFGPSGWMGDFGDIEMNDAYSSDLLKDDPDAKNTQWKYTPTGANKWCGVQYQNADQNWGDLPGRAVINATKIVFHARGEKGGEVVKFSAGGRPDANNKYNNSFFVEEKKTLTTSWQKFEFDLTGKKTDSVLWGFGWVVSGADVTGDNCTFYVDEIRYEM